MPPASLHAAGVYSPFRLSRLTGVLVGAVLLATQASAQAPINLVANPLIGSRVRVSGPSVPGERVIGRVLAMTGDRIVLGSASGDEPHTIALGPDTRLETWRRGTAAETMGIVTGVAGAVAGARYYVHWCRDNPDACREDLSYKHVDEDDCYEDTCEKGNFTFLSFTVLGSMIAGATLGYVIVPPRWRPVDRPFRLSVVPAGGGRVLIGASYAFYARPSR